MISLDTTQELYTDGARPATTARAEAQTRKFGHWSFRAGITLGVISCSACLIAADLTGNNMWHDSPTARLYSVLGLVALASTSGALMLIGGVERLLRPVRQRQRDAGLATDRLRILVERLTVDHHDLQKVTAPLPEQLAATTECLRVLIDVLPEEIQRRYWAGYNDAVREGFNGATGTDGAKGRRYRHIGLVPHAPNSPETN